MSSIAYEIVLAVLLGGILGGLIQLTGILRAIQKDVNAIRIAQMSRRTNDGG